MLLAMIHTDSAIARIRAYLRDCGVAKSRLAADADVPEGCIRKVMEKDWNPTSDTLRALERAVPADFIHKAKAKRANGKNGNGHA